MAGQKRFRGAANRLLFMVGNRFRRVSKAGIFSGSHFDETHGGSVFRDDVYFGELFSHIAFQDAETALPKPFAHKAFPLGPRGGRGFPNPVHGC